MLVNKLKSRLQIWMTALLLRISAAVILMIEVPVFDLSNEPVNQRERKARDLAQSAAQPYCQVNRQTCD